MPSITEDVAMEDVTESSGNDTDDDYEQTERLKRRQRHSRGGEKDEDEDGLASDVVAEDPNTLEVEGTSKKKKRGQSRKAKKVPLSEKAKGKQKEVTQEAEVQESADPAAVQELVELVDSIKEFAHDAAVIGDSFPESKFRTGPLSADAKAKLGEVEETLEDLWKALSKCFHKPPEYFPRYLGYGIPPSVSGRTSQTKYNLYQAKFAADNKGKVIGECHEVTGIAFLLTRVV